MDSSQPKKAKLTNDQGADNGIITYVHGYARNTIKTTMNSSLYYRGAINIDVWPDNI